MTRLQQGFFIPQLKPRTRPSSLKLAVPVAVSTLLFSPLLRAETVQKDATSVTQPEKDKKSKKTEKYQGGSKQNHLKKSRR